MKKILILAGFCSLMITAVTSMSQPVTSFYGYTWLRYTLADKVTSDPNQFEIPRTYIRMKTTINPNISGQLTLDINNSESAQSYVKGTTSTKVADWRIFVKYAYVDIGGLIPEAIVRIGMQKVYFATLDMWEYPIIEKEITDLAGLLSSADQGIAIDGNIPGGFGEYQVAVYNGAGYAKVEDNAKKALAASVMVIPLPGIWLRTSYYGDYFTSSADLNKRLIGAVLGFNFAPLTGHVEFVLPQDPTKGDLAADTVKSGRGFEFFVASKIPVPGTFLDKMQVCFRYDLYKDNVDVLTSAKDASWVIGGLNYQVAANLLMQFNIENKMYEDTTLAVNREISYILQTQLSW